MNRPTTITEIIGRSEQGTTRPFVCRDDTGRTWYVKGAYAGLRSLSCEWVAHRLAWQLLSGDLPGVPEFRMAEVPDALITGSERPDAHELGGGLVFVSLEIEGGQELHWAGAQGWPEETMAMILLLDLWLRNEDRSLSALGGNPNLLVTQIPTGPAGSHNRALTQEKPGRRKLWAYDFNLAFDEDFSRERFFGAHVFGGALWQWPEGFRERMEPRLRAALHEVGTIFAELPLEWLYVDGDDSLPVQLDREKVVSALELPFTEPANFWNLP